MTLINDTWTQNDLTNTWFTSQLPQLTSSYSSVNTYYHLMSLNGHFTHYSAIPANNIGAFTAKQLHDPTVAAALRAPVVLHRPQRRQRQCTFHIADLLDRLPFRPECRE